jgi:hypothetical protein
MYSVANDATCWETGKDSSPPLRVFDCIIFGNVHTVYMVYMCIGILTVHILRLHCPKTIDKLRVEALVIPIVVNDIVHHVGAYTVTVLTVD